MQPVLAEDIVEALKADPDAWSSFLAFPDLYRRVRIGYIEEMRKDQSEFERRLRTLSGRLRPTRCLAIGTMAVDSGDIERNLTSQANAITLNVVNKLSNECKSNPHPTHPHCFQAAT